MKRVETYFVSAPSSWTSDFEIKEKIRAALIADPALVSGRVDIVVYAGHVVLSAWWPRLSRFSSRGRRALREWRDRELKGRIDRLGWALDYSWRYTITPYIHYEKEEDLYVVHMCVVSNRSEVPLSHRCFDRERRQEEATGGLGKRSTI